MDKEKDIDRFTEYLRTYTSIAESSVRLYARTISRYIDQQNELTIDNINRFVSQSFRESRSTYVKYAFQYYLKYMGKESWYKKIVKAKVRSKKKPNKRYSKEVIQSIIDNISREKYRDMSRIQYATGARAREIITIKEENIDMSHSNNAISIYIIGKGDKARHIFLSRYQFEPLLRKYMRDRAGYIFLDHCYNIADDPELEVAIDTQRRYMDLYLQEAIDRIGLQGFGTHDFRRNVAEIITTDRGIKAAQMALGHSDARTTMNYLNSNRNEEVEDAMIRHQEGNSNGRNPPQE